MTEGASIKSESFRFTEAAKASGVKPKDLRNWVQRNKIRLSSPAPSDSSWRTFTVADMCILAVMRPLVGYGIGVTVSNHIALAIVREESLDLDEMVRITDWGIRFDRIVAAYVWHDGQQWQHECFSAAPDESPLWPPSAHAILLRIDTICADVFQRAENDRSAEGKGG